MNKIDWTTLHLQYKGGAIWRVKKQNHIFISKAPRALFRKNTVFIIFPFIAFDSFFTPSLTYSHCALILTFILICIFVFAYNYVRASIRTTYYWLNILTIWQDAFQFTFLMRWTIVENFSWTLRSLSWDCTSEFCSLQMIRYLSILCSTASYLHGRSGRNCIIFFVLNFITSYN